MYMVGFICPPVFASTGLIAFYIFVEPAAPKSTLRDFCHLTVAGPLKLRPISTKPFAAFDRPSPGAPDASTKRQSERTKEMAVKSLVPAALTGLILSAALSAAPAAAQQPASLASDSIFIQTAGSVGLLQVKLGKLAEKKGSSPSVVEFGQRMAADYSKANQELAAAAKQAAFPAPSLLRQHQQLFDRFSRMGRSGFDKAYMSEMVTQHSDEVRLFQQEAEAGRVQMLKQVAGRMLPDMQQRLSVATQTAGSIGALVTASSAGSAQRSTGK
jgi:putative membrane protein